jgi:PAS domain S-box-containing protein
MLSLSGVAVSNDALVNQSPNAAAHGDVVAENSLLGMTGRARQLLVSAVATADGDWRLPAAAIALSAILFAIAAPFAKLQLAPIGAFIPAYEAALLICDLITAVLFFGQFAQAGTTQLLALASAYLFDALMTIVHALSFPGLFTPTGLLGGGEATAWLYMFWHIGFPLFVVAYVVWPNHGTRPGTRSNRRLRVVAWMTAVVVTATLCALLAANCHRVLPTIMQGNGYTPALIFVVSSVWAFSLGALLALWLKRPRSVLDLWLMVVMCAWLFDVALSAVLNHGRFDLGFYAGRIYGLVAASFVLSMLIAEIGGLYSRLAAATGQLEAHAAVLEDRVRDRTADLLSANRELTAIIAASPVAVFMIAGDGRVVFWGASAERVFGYTEAEALGQRPSQLFDHWLDEAMADITRASDDPAASGSSETRHRCKDGVAIDTLASWVRVNDEAGKMRGIMYAVANISRHKQTEQNLFNAQERSKQTLAALRNSEATLRRAQRIAQIGTTLRNLQTGEVEWSDEAYRIMGVTRGAWAPTQENILALIHPDDRDKAAGKLFPTGGQAISPVEGRIIRPDGNVRVLYREHEIIRDEDGNPLYLAGTVQDITERKNTEEQLRQSQKMEAIGNLTGGMAHDFNNLLGIIIGNLDIARDKVGDDDDLNEMIGEALDAAWRGADLTRRLLAFARRQPLRPVRVDVNKLVKDTVKLLRRLIGEDVQVELTLADGVWSVIVDPAQLEASLANLATNARDAMPKGGRLIIATANRQLDADYVAAHSDASIGDFVMIEVSDTGTGMSPEIMSRVFEPFFTTKEAGKGTGLGLSMVFGFLRQSEGHVNVYSEVGVGTTFRLYLPRAAVETAQRDVNDAHPIARGTGQSVLVVEDNAGMRRIVQRQIGELGYRVVDCDSAAAGLEVLQREPIDLLFTDIVMPGGLDGIELAKLARDHWPALKIVLTSGFPQSRLDGDGTVFHGMELLSKPYSKEALAQTLRAVLQG